MQSRIIWVCWALKSTNKSVDWAREALSVLGFVSISWFECLLEMQDPTDQSGIDLFMVRELDGTQNEWGWPKAKVWVSVELAKPLTEKICLYGNFYCHSLFAIVCILQMSWLQEMVHSNCGLEMFMCTFLHSMRVLCVCSFLNIPFYWIPFAPSLLMFVLFQLGANAILSVSLAVCKAGAGVKKIPLYQVGSLTPCSPVLLVLLIRCCMGCVGFDNQLL